MFFLDGERYLLGGLLLVVANAAQSVAMMLYNSYLPQIAPPEERDAVSSRGWALGYAAGSLMLIVNLALYLGHDAFGVSESTAVRICLASAGLWWGAFALVPLRRLRDRRTVAREEALPGLRQLAATVRDMRRHPLTLAFLLAYLVYNDGIQTVITQASVYGSEELGLGQSTLIGAVLLVQVLAVAGALAMGGWRVRTVRSGRSSVRWWRGRSRSAPGTSCRPGHRCGSSCWRPGSGWSSAAARPCPAPSSRTWSRRARRRSTSRRTR
ncbi:hypothetical protein GCM10020256_65650 [Streptomyces thermocoprophilus]